jgi:hypothetical protein
VRVVVPAAGQGGPDALPQDVHQLGSHFLLLFKSSSSLSLPKMHLKKLKNIQKFAIILTAQMRVHLSIQITQSD